MSQATQESKEVEDKIRTKNWTFTWPNYKPGDIEDIKTKWLTAYKLKCVCFGQEVAPKTGTPHLQGFMVFISLKTFKQVKELFPKQIHFEKMKGTIEQNKTYCSKESPLFTIGQCPMSQQEKGEAGRLATKKDYLGPDFAKGADLKNWAAQVDDGERPPANGKHNRAIWRRIQAMTINGASKQEIALAFPETLGLHPKGFNETYEMFKPKPEYDIRQKHAKLFDWQIEFLKLMDQEPNSRTIHWVWSKAGATGKSETVKHLVFTEGFEPLQNAPTRDISCAWKGGDVVFDYTRDISESPINYSVLEAIKNRMLFSPKYESTTKSSHDMKDVFVVCFSNRQPDVATDKMSNDRWEIYRICPEGNKPWVREYVHERDGRAWITDEPQVDQNSPPEAAQK